MKELTIGTNDAGQRLDRFLAKAVPLLPASLAGGGGSIAAVPQR